MTPTEIYDALTDGRRKFVRVDELCYRAAERFAGVLPSAADLAADAGRLQKGRSGVEKSKGRFVSAAPADATAGGDLCHAMLLPMAGSQARLAEFEAKG